MKLKGNRMGEKERARRIVVIMNKKIMFSEKEKLDEWDRKVVCMRMQ